MPDVPVTEDRIDMAKYSFTIPLAVSVIEANRQSLCAAGVILPSPSVLPVIGTLPQTKGVIVSYQYGGKDIMFTIESKPFIISNSAVEHSIRQAIEHVTGCNIP